MQTPPNMLKTSETQKEKNARYNLYTCSVHRPHFHYVNLIHVEVILCEFNSCEVITVFDDILFFRKLHVKQDECISMLDPKLKLNDCAKQPETGDLSEQALIPNKQLLQKNTDQVVWCIPS